ncbi:MAG: M14 family zinc carboxypeptidase, partial [Bacteroidota bacterium]
HQSAFSQDIEKLNRDNISISWADCISAYKKLDVENKSAQLIEAGLTDVGKPLHLFVLSKDGIFDPVVAKRKGKTVLMILNGIHPGEPDGIDASVRLSQNLLSGKTELPSNVVICIIPVYNIDGSLNNRCCTRANQNGPINQGFRGNARNLDLNRDFIKCDSENAKSFTKIFRDWDPDVFVDTHVSNGADYQHVMTLISTQHNKLGGASGEFMKKQMTPALFVAMEKRGFPMSPYVNTLKYDYPPENGIYGFMETPRFASGYAALYQSLAFVTETHMLKPFPLRVDATQAMLEEFIKYTSANAEVIREARIKDRSDLRKSTSHVIDWKVDTNIVEFVPFLGFEPYYQKSPVTGQDQLYYDRGKPFNRNVKFYDEYVASKTVKIPAFYIVPQAWSEVIERLKLNKIEFMRLNRDTVIELSTYSISNYKSSSKPYEGHYTRSETEIVEENKRMKLYEGDYMIPTDQDAIRYLIETLEPHAPDSWFSWGFFDSILQQKEWFSAYVFDDMAARILADSPELKSVFQAKKIAEPEFAKSSFEQLYFIYKNSEWFEDLNRYPVYRCFDVSKEDLGKTCK